MPSIRPTGSVRTSATSRHGTRPWCGRSVPLRSIAARSGRSATATASRVPRPVMPPPFWVASTKPESHLTAARLECLAKAKGGLWRSVIAGQKPACIAGRGTSTTEAGRAAERRAWWFYRVRGYRILDTNVWLGGNELDLVVRRGRRLAFVEVKAKSGGRH